jgi:hypothetical protein
MMRSTRHNNLIENSNLEMMVACKSLGLTASSSMTAIGAVLFDRTGKTAVHLDPAYQFYVPVSQADATMSGFGAEKRTLQWIRENPQTNSPLPPEIDTATTSVRSACEQFLDFLNEHQPSRIWNNRSKFHLNFFEGVCKKVGINFEFDHLKTTDYSAIMDVAYPDRNDRPVHNEELVGYPRQHALGDAIMQAVNLIEVLKHYQPLVKPQERIDATVGPSKKPRPR